MADPEKDLPDPLEDSAATPTAENPDDLLAQMADEAINRLIADADKGLMPAPPPPASSPATPAEIKIPVAPTAPVAPVPAPAGPTDDLAPAPTLAPDDVDSLQSALDTVFTQLHDEPSPEPVREPPIPADRASPSDEPPRDDSRTDESLADDVSLAEDVEPVSETEPDHPVEEPSAAAPVDAPAEDAPAEAEPTEEEPAEDARQSPAESPVESEAPHASEAPIAIQTPDAPPAAPADDPAMQTDVKALLDDAVQNEPSGAAPAFIVRPLQWINAPFAGLSDRAREILGLVGIITLINATALILYVLFFKK